MRQFFNYVFRVNLLFLLSGTLGGSAALAQSTDPCLLAGAQSLTSSSKLDFIDPQILTALSLTKTQRLQVICDIKAAVINNYSLIPLKKERLGIDAEQLMEDCARTEAQLDDSDRQNFMDRVQACIAGFHDTHFAATARIDRPTVMTAFVGWNIGGRVFVLRQSSKIIARIKADDPDTFADLDKVLAPGGEVLQIDGQPVAEAVKALMPYSLASSDAYAQIAATESVFTRNYKYPTSKTIKVDIKTADGKIRHLELPWFVQLGQGNLDAQAKLKALGLAVVNDLQMTFDPTTNRYVKNTDSIYDVGYSYRNPMFTRFATLVTYNDDEGNPGLRTSEVVVDRDHLFCYVQLLTFESDNFTNAETKDKLKFMEPIQKFVANCESKKLPLVLDLKYNPGGNGNLPAQLLAALSQTGSKYGPDVQAYPASTTLIDLIANGITANSVGARDLDQGPDAQAALEALSDALKAGQPTTDVLKSGDITADPKVGGFSQRIVAVISPLCISACDMTAHLLKNSGRAVMLGAPSNGTGAGFMSENKLDSNFQDSIGLFKFSIPNFLFGVETKAGDPSRLPFAQYKGLLTENQPTPVDIAYTWTPSDLAKSAAGLEAAVVNALSAQ